MLTKVEIFSNTILEFYLVVYFSFYNLCGKEYMCRKGDAQDMGDSHVEVRRQVAETYAVWVPGIELSSSGLAENTFTSQAMFLGH